MVTAAGAVPSDAERRDAFVDLLGDASVATFQLAAIVIGIRLRLYDALHEAGPATSVELAARTGTSERAVREWLEHGAVTGLLDLVADADDPTARQFGLPAGHAEVLLDRDSLSYGAGTAMQVVAALGSIPMILDSFRTGAGFSFGDVDDAMRTGEGDSNRPSYLGPLGREWLPSIGDVDARLRADPPARIADVGCGLGWSSIGMAIAYPMVQIDAVDLDAPSIERAHRNVAEAGLAHRVRVSVADATGTGLVGPYELVTVFEAFHDMPHPVRVLSELRRLLAPGGSVLIVDSKTAERFQAPGDDVERRFYGWSLMHCLHSGLNDGGVGTGTAMRPGTLRAYAEQAGLARVDVLPIEHEAWRFYRLRAAPLG
jgi:SAM-dependent methyltransferase